MLICILAVPALFAQPPDFPVYVLTVPNPNDYALFANSGWDGNWYVGYNTCWVKKLPPVPPGSYGRAFIGAKLGRMKLLPSGKKPWKEQPISGDIFIAISSTPSWKGRPEVRLTATSDIPSEGDPEMALATTGESEWFWAEIPLRQVNLKGDNYLALWSPTPGLISVSSSPVLAAAWGGRDMDTWLSRDVQGKPPSDPAKVLGTGLSYFQPAMALKLIPGGLPRHSINVRIISWQNGSADHPPPVITAAVEGDSIERTWVEYSVDEKKWTQVGRPLWKAPHAFSLDFLALPKGRVALRVAAANVWEEVGASASFTVDVSTISVSTTPSGTP